MPPIWTYAAATALAFLPGLAISQEPASYPTRLANVVVAAPPGAATDVIARVLAERLTGRLGQQFIVENRPGASGLVAAGYVVKQPPDGYTLLLASSTVVIAPHVLAKGAGDIDVLKDLTPVVKVASSPLVITVHPSLGVNTIQEYIALSRKGSGLSYATSGTGSALHIAGELLQRKTGAKLLHVPYKGLGQAAADVMSGQVQSLFGTTGGVITVMINTRKTIPLAVAARQRSPLLPNVPTLAEAGIPDMDFPIWFALYARSGTPSAVLTRLNEESRRILGLADVRQSFTATGVDAGGGTLVETVQHVQAESERYGRLVSDFGIKQQ